MSSRNVFDMFVAESEGEGFELYSTDISNSFKSMLELKVDAPESIENVFDLETVIFDIWSNIIGLGKLQMTASKRYKDVFLFRFLCVFSEEK
ncbi:hypothetical protein [Agaribacter marinus]|nr:hypothetical protein [Agaribacter marinus]